MRQLAEEAMVTSYSGQDKHLDEENVAGRHESVTQPQLLDRD